ncbi:TIGR03619 family F420-dependent LLM class oxidoreductase [Spirillospora sp. CA-294931]|uniref:TIGR03619 family F420-dependent LLM class oxidoreductase n=1 Tax=Spirillospora sp. CA-294931 TaxID=3240042 RepID=UPI003D89FD7D
MIKFGVNILNFGSGTGPESLSGWAGYAEDRGFHLAMISDHVAVTPDVATQYPAPFYDPFATLSWLAGRTSRIELGTTVVIVPYRHPLLTARMAANIDRFSGGRFVFGIGVSWPEQEYAALGVPFGRRGAITDEYLEVIIAAWENDVITHDGEFVSFADVQTGPRPLRRPPVWVGGGSPAALRRTARFGDAWHPLNVRLDWLREEGLPGLRKAADQAGRPVPAFAPRLPLRLTTTPLDDDSRLAGQGTLDQIRGDLEALAALGASSILFDTYPGPEEGVRPLEDDLRMLDAIVETAIDLEAATLR